MNQQSTALAYLHIVWATKNRQPIFLEQNHRAAFRIMEAEAQRLKCHVLALNGTSDHVHILIRLSRTVTIAQLINNIKGVSSAYLNRTNRDSETAGRFRWQDGYAVFSIGKNQIKPVIRYIEGQKERHQTGQLWSDWEPGDDPIQISQNK